MADFGDDYLNPYHRKLDTNVTNSAFRSRRVAEHNTQPRVSSYFGEHFRIVR